MISRGNRSRIQAGKRILSILQLLALLGGVTWSATRQSAAAEPALLQTQNVILVVIDGLRHSEAFGDSTHQYIPRMWNELRPQGTLYTEFYNDFGTTYTAPGHLAMITGRWHQLPNVVNMAGTFDVRSTVPTVFEYFRKSTGADQASAWIIAGKHHLVKSDWSLEPSYGPAYRANLMIGGSDSLIVSELEEVLQRDRPRLVLVNLADVDSYGHKAIWDDYTAAIQTADALVAKIWLELIQEDPHYRDATTLLVTSDHGRHLSGYGDFINHGGMCSGDRHVSLLALGPDTPSGHVVSERRYLIDLAPSIGAFLGFPTPFTQGQVLAELFTQPGPFLESESRIHQHDPQAVVAGDRLWVAFAANDSSDTGNGRAFVMSSTLDSIAFSAPLRLDTSPRWIHRPTLVSSQEDLFVAWSDHRPLDELGDNWSVVFRHSGDVGANWDSEMVLAGSRYETDENDLADILAFPHLVAKESTVVSITGSYNRDIRRILVDRSIDGGVSWQSRMLAFGTSFPKDFNSVMLDHPRQLVITFSDLAQSVGQDSVSDWEVFLLRTLDGGLTWDEPSRMSDAPGPDRWPVVAWGNGTLLLVWASSGPDGGPWQIKVRLSADYGSDFSPVWDLPGGAGWQPSVAWGDGRFWLAWAAESGILVSASSDGYVWTQPVAVASSIDGGIQRKPSVAAGAGRTFVTWEEQITASGDWRVRAAEAHVGTHVGIARARLK